MNPKDTPIIINNRDRLTCLCELVTWLYELGHHNLTILDNDSTYPPLLEYYEALEGMVNVVPLRKNLGSKALWCWSEARKMIRPPFIYTDPDVVPIAECPDDIVSFLLRVADYLGCPHKIGLGLKIDDIPDHYAAAPMVREWESQFWTQRIGELEGVPIYHAAVDTTFALYTDFTPFSLHGVRTGPPYVARHLPWYLDSKQPGDEELFYEQHASKAFHNWGIETCSSRAVLHRCNGSK